MISELLVVLCLDNRLLELSSRDATSEHDVDLAVRSTFHLRKTIVRRDPSREGGSTPHIAALATNYAIVR